MGKNPSDISPITLDVHGVAIYFFDQMETIKQIMDLTRQKHHRIDYEHDEHGRKHLILKWKNSRLN